MRQTFRFFLDWLPNVQFAGICWAIDRGLYSDSGLDVVLVPWVEDGRGIVEKVMSGGLCAGSAEDNLIVAANACARHRVSGLAAMFQLTPLVVMSRPETGIRSITDLRGKKVAMHCDGIRILEGLLSMNGIGSDELELVEVSHDLDNLAAHRFDAVQGYAVAEPLELASRGLDVVTFPLRHRELHPYAQVVFAADALLASHRNVYERFLHASFEGWRACLNDLDQAMASIRRVGVSMDDPEREIEALRLVRRLVSGEDPAPGLGCIDPDRWAANLQAYRGLGIVPHDASLSCALDATFWPGGPRFSADGLRNGSADDAEPLLSNSN